MVPLPVAGLEDILLWELMKLVLFGTCGVLDGDKRGLLLSPSHALRDEGGEFSLCGS